MNERLVAALLTTASLAIGAFVAAAAEGSGKHLDHAVKSDLALAAQVRVNVQAARATALAKVPGSKFKTVELEREKGNLIWSFELVVPDKPGVDEVNVDAISGKVISVEHEGARTEAREAKHDRREARPDSTKAAKPSSRRGAPTAWLGPASVPGIRHFGRVTSMLYRGGDFMPNGVESIVRLGVQTVISLRSHDRHGEPDSCASHGIAYHLFRMNTQARPDSAAMDSVLDIIRNAKAPVYVHCTGGQHRTGTVCALYRIRVQGWAPKRAWAEQEAYGFGPVEHHADLFHFVYGDGSELK